MVGEAGPCVEGKKVKLINNPRHRIDKIAIITKYPTLKEGDSGFDCDCFFS